LYLYSFFVSPSGSRAVGSFPVISNHFHSALSLAHPVVGRGSEPPAAASR
jgi:hypothetical protein